MGPLRPPDPARERGLPSPGDHRPIPCVGPHAEDGAGDRPYRSGEAVARTLLNVTTPHSASNDACISGKGTVPLARSRALRTRLGDERGAALVESLVASVLLGVALLVLGGSYSTFAIASTSAKQVAIGQTFARAQAARIKAAPYQADGDYSAYYDSLPSGLSRSLAATWWDGTSAWSGTQNANGLQKLVLTITWQGDNIAVIEFVKANR
jgi:Tfp pilus assembly protein PilV